MLFYTNSLGLKVVVCNLKLAGTLEKSFSCHIDLANQWQDISADPGGSCVLRVRSCAIDLNKYG